MVKALRQNRISTIDAANRFLEHTYLKEHNTRFAHPDGLRDIHRPSDGLDLDNIFCFETTRRLYNDYTITLDNQFIQLEKSEAPLPPPGRSVTLRTWLDGSLHLFWNEQELALTPLAARPAVAVQPSQNPGQASTHPWRHKNPIGPGGRYLVEKRTMKSTTTQKKKSVSSNPAPP
ncbi:MAG: hypothetical protein HY033_08590 [Ignavibacteriae bacterium]|nr:hypothetical protein [Ignavibacteriota bacterium]